METSCLEWMAARSKAGYGQLWNPESRKVEYTHRRAWEFEHGPIPEGMIIAHHCDNPPCCEPSHLFLTTKAGNSADMKRKGRVVKSWTAIANAEKTHCPHGHEYSEKNTLYSCGRRHCRTCTRERQRRKRCRQ